MRILIALVLFAPAAFAQATHVNIHGDAIINGTFTPPKRTVATLPTASTNADKIFVVTDSSTAGNCTTGGGSAQAICWNNGSTWVSIGGSTGGGITLSGYGIVARTSEGNYAPREITGGTNIEVTNGTAVSGNPVIAYTAPIPMIFDTAGCNEANEGVTSFPNPVSGTAAAPFCDADAYVRSAGLRFPNTGTTVRQVFPILAPDSYSECDVTFQYRTVPTSGVIRWILQYKAVAAGESVNAVDWSTAATVNSTAPATTLAVANATFNAVIPTSAEGKTIYLRISRDSNHADDTLAGNGDLQRVALIFAQ